MISNFSLLFLAIAKAALLTGFGPGVVVMGLYNFQKRFVPKVLSGEKTHTIRALRSNPDKPGNVLHLYTGLRQKGARLLMRAKCVKVEEISIALTPENFLDDDGQCVFVAIDGSVLSQSEREALAVRDGFADFDEMLDFWAGRLPFTGHIIHWRFSEPSSGGGQLVRQENRFHRSGATSPPRKVRHA